MSRLEKYTDKNKSGAHIFLLQQIHSIHTTFNREIICAKYPRNLHIEKKQQQQICEKMSLRKRHRLQFPNQQ